MTDEEQFEQIIFPKILADERLCRLTLQNLIRHGVKIDTPLNDLTHEQCIELSVRLYGELKRIEQGLGGDDPSGGLQ